MGSLDCHCQSEKTAWSRRHPENLRFLNSKRKMAICGQGQGSDCNQRLWIPVFILPSESPHVGFTNAPPPMALELIFKKHHMQLQSKRTDDVKAIALKIFLFLITEFSVHDLGTNKKSEVRSR